MVTKLLTIDGFPDFFTNTNTAFDMAEYWLHKTQTETKKVLCVF